MLRMKIIVAVAGLVLGFGLIATGLSVLFKATGDLGGMVGTLVVITGTMVYGVGSELVGELRAERRHQDREHQARSDRAA